MSKPATNQTPPPSLTWKHLFPSDATFACADGPSWFRQKMSENGSVASASIKVFWNDAISSRNTDRSDDGLVAINCRKFPLEQLQSEGYGYIRHFAAVPNLQHARWFVPLDSPAVASAGLSLYTPTRRLAKVHRAGLRLAMQTRLPLWYRDHVWIAQRNAPPIEKAVNPLIPSADVRWALSSGAPEGARNRKASALLIAPDGTLMAFVKLAASAIARKNVEQEIAALEHLGRLPALANSVPRLLFDGEVDGVRVLVQKPLPGVPARVGITPAHRSFLQSLQAPVTVNAATTSMSAALLPRLRALPTLRTDLIEVCNRVMDELREFSVPMTIIHGDFAPWNLRSHNGRVAAFDWEYGELHGLPLIDEIHYRLQCGWLLEHWGTDEALQCLDALGASRPLGLGHDQVETLASVYLIDALTRLLGEGYEDEQDVVSWHRNLLDRLTFRATHSKLEGALA